MKLTLLEELKLRAKERSYKLEAKTEEESTPMKAGVSPFVHSKSNPKPSKEHHTSLPDIPGSTDWGTVLATADDNKTSIPPDHHSSSSSCHFEKNVNDPNTKLLPTNKPPDEEAKYEHNNDDTLSIYTESTYVSTTASTQSINGRKKKKKRKKKRKPRIIQQGNHISVSRSNTPPHMQHRTRYSQSHDSHQSPLHLSQRNLDEHNHMLRKRNVNAGLSIINVIGDGIPHNNTKAVAAKHTANPPHALPNDVVIDADTELAFTESQTTHVLSASAVIWSTNIFAFFCSVDLMVNIPTLYKACVDMDMNMDNNLFIWILVVYVVFQIIAALIISVFMNYERIKWILVILCTFLLLGNVLYTHGISPQNDSNVFLLFVGRAMCGIAGSIVINGYSINTLCSNILNREFLIVMFRFITSIGMLIGPLLGLILSLDIWSSRSMVFGLWHIKDTNGGSFFMALVSVVYLLCFIVYLSCIYLRESNCNQSEEDHGDNSNDIANMYEQRSDNYSIDKINKTHGASIKASTDAIVQRQQVTEEYTKAVQVIDNRSNHSLGCNNKYVVLLLFLYISCLFTFWALLAVIIPIGVYHNDHDDTDNNNNQLIIYGVFALMGVFYIISFAINRGLNYKIFKKTSFDKRVIVAIHIQCIGYFLLTTFGVYDPLTSTAPYSKSIPLIQLIFAMWFIVVGFGIATLQIPAIFCLITGTKLKNIGIRMSWFFIISSIGRIIGPIFGWYVIKTQNGSIDLLAHLSAFYLIIISFIALLVLMEANKDTAFFPKGYYEEREVRDEATAPDVALYSNRKVLNRVPSKSLTQHSGVNTSQSRSRLAAHFVDESSTNEQSKDYNDTYEKECIKGEDMKVRDDNDKNNNDDNITKKHHNYSPVYRTESGESIKVAFKSKKTFIEKYQIDTSNNEVKSSENLLEKIKRKSSRFLNSNNANSENKKQKKSSPNIQAPDVGLTDYQL